MVLGIWCCFQKSLPISAETRPPRHLPWGQAHVPWVGAFLAGTGLGTGVGGGNQSPFKDAQRYIRVPEVHLEVSELSCVDLCRESGSSQKTPGRRGES